MNRREFLASTTIAGLTALLVSILPFWLVIIEWVRPPRRRPNGAVMVGLVLVLMLLYRPQGIFPEERIISPEARLGGRSGNDS